MKTFFGAAFIADAGRDESLGVVMGRRAGSKCNQRAREARAIDAGRERGQVSVEKTVG